MIVCLCYQNSMVEIPWRLPFLPRIGEYLSIIEILSEKQFEQLGAKKDYFEIFDVSWFPDKKASLSVVEIHLR